VLFSTFSEWVPVTDSRKLWLPPVFELVAPDVRRTSGLKRVRVRSLDRRKKEAPRWGASFLVPVTGLEPVRHRWRRILSFVTHLEIHGI